MAQRNKPALLTGIILLSLFFALVLGVYPLGHTVSLLRPEFVCLLVVYWVVTYPHRLGVLFAWGIGFFQDVVEGTVWGGHALALTILAYICLLSWQRIRSYSIWQQSMWVFVLVGTHQVVVSWVQGLAGYHSPTHMLLLPTIASALSWPLIYFGLQRVRLRARVS